MVGNCDTQNIFSPCLGVVFNVRDTPYTALRKTNFMPKAKMPKLKLLCIANFFLGIHDFFNSDTEALEIENYDELQRRAFDEGNDDISVNQFKHKGGCHEEHGELSKCQEKVHLYYVS